MRQSQNHQTFSIYFLRLEEKWWSRQRQSSARTTRPTNHTIVRTAISTQTALSVLFSFRCFWAGPPHRLKADGHGTEWCYWFRGLCQRISEFDWKLMKLWLVQKQEIADPIVREKSCHIGWLIEPLLPISFEYVGSLYLIITRKLREVNPSAKPDFQLWDFSKMCKAVGKPNFIVRLPNSVVVRLKWLDRYI